MKSLVLLPLALGLLVPPPAGGGMRTHRTKEVIIKSNAPVKTIKAVGKRVDHYCELFRDFYDELGLNKKNTNTIKLRLFDTYGEYEQFYQRAVGSDRGTPLAFFSPSLNSVVMYNDERDVALRAVTFHECSHQFLNRYTYDAPKWLNEGLAEYFEGWRVTEGEPAVRRPHLYDLSLVRKAVKEGEYLSPRELIEMDRDKFNHFGREYPQYHSYLHYATSWSIVYYCLESSYEDDQERLINFLRDLTEKGPSATFEVDDWDQFEERWKRWLLRFEVEPEDAVDHFLLAIGHRMNADFEEAAKEFEKALELDPELPRAGVWLGYCLMKSGEDAKALATLERSLESDEEDHWAAYLAALTCFRQSSADGDEWVAKALVHAERASDLMDDEDPRYLWMVARCLVELDEEKKAIRTARKILKVVEDEEVEYWETQVDLIRELAKTMKG